MKHFLLVISIIFCVAPHLAAQDGTPDPSYGTGGKNILAIPNMNHTYGYFNRVRVQPDGKIIQMYTRSFGTPVNSIKLNLVRYGQNGTVDSSFGTNGIVVTPGDSLDVGMNLLMQPDGKILVCGYHYDGGLNYSALVMRFHNNGRLDSSFATNGRFTSAYSGYGFIQTMAIQQDGKILLGGEFLNLRQLTLMRLLPNGTLDNTFGTGGKVTGLRGSAFDMLLQPDGKIVVAGSHTTYTLGDTIPPDFNFYSARFLLNGTPDPAFGSSGQTIISMGGQQDIAYGIALQPDGKIVYTGRTGSVTANQLYVLRLNANGANDAGFGQGGKTLFTLGATQARGNTIAVQTDGKLLIGAEAGNISDTSISMMRLTSTGTLDAGFGTTGMYQLPKPASTHEMGGVFVMQGTHIIMAGASKQKNATSGSGVLTARILNSVAVYIPALFVTAINAPAWTNSIRMGPVPAQDILNLQLPAGKTLMVEIMDINGVLFSRKVCKEKTVLSLQGMIPGTYIIRFRDPRTQEATQKIFIKQ